MLQTAWKRVFTFVQLIAALVFSVLSVFLPDKQIAIPLKDYAAYAFALIVFSVLGIVLAVKSMLSLSSRPKLTLAITLFGLLETTLMYAASYRILQAMNPRSFTVKPLTGVDALYYSISTFADFGTLHPVSTTAKWVVMSQMVLTFFIGTFVMSLFVTFLLQRATKRESQ